VVEELGPEPATNAPGAYENEPSHQPHAYAFFSHLMDAPLPTGARWTSGPSLDGKGRFSLVEPAPALGEEPQLQKAPPEVHAGAEARDTGVGAAAKRFTRALGSAVDE
jgi:Mn-containing catalase